MEIVKRSDGMRRRAVTAEEWDEIWRLEELAVRACELEALGERILSAAVRGHELSAVDRSETA